MQIPKPIVIVLIVFGLALFSGILDVPVFGKFEMIRYFFWSMWEMTFMAMGFIVGYFFKKI